MDNFSRIMELSDTVIDQELHELHKKILEMQCEVDKWKAIAEDRKRLLDKVLS